LSFALRFSQNIKNGGFQFDFISIHLPQSVINDNSQADFHWGKTKHFFFLKNPIPKTKKLSFSSSTNFQKKIEQISLVV